MKSPGLISQAVEFWKGDSGWNEMVDPMGQGRWEGRLSQKSGRKKTRAKHIGGRIQGMITQKFQSAACR